MKFFALLGFFLNTFTSISIDLYTFFELGWQHPVRLDLFYAHMVLSTSLLLGYIVLFTSEKHQLLTIEAKAYLFYLLIGIILGCIFWISRLDIQLGFLPVAYLMAVCVILTAFYWNVREAITVFGLSLLGSLYLMWVHQVPLEILISFELNLFIFSTIFFFISRGAFRAMRREFEGQHELERAKAEAEKAAEVKAQFLSTMSHEIRTPMYAVTGFTELLLEEDPLPRQIENLNALKFSADNLLVLINDILDFSKIEAGKLVIEKHPFHINNILANIRLSFQGRLWQKGLEFVLDVDSRVPNALLGDSVRLTQVLNNLVSNAIKFTERGRILLTVRLLGLTTGANGQKEAKLLFAVKDTGIGIPTDKQQMIFDSFTQASPQTTRKYGGTGLGLAITKRLLELQGSHIQLESEEGAGARFSFVISYEVTDTQPMMRSQIGLQQMAALDLSQVKILMAEDDTINVQIARKLLKKYKISLIVVENGQDAFHAVQAQDFDLVLMDLQMPIMDGFEAAKRIRELPDERFKRLPILALTASAMSEVREKVVRYGMNGYISKPTSSEELYRKILAHLDEGKLKFQTVASSTEFINDLPYMGDQLMDLTPFKELCADDPRLLYVLLTGSADQFSEFAKLYRQFMEERKLDLLRPVIHKVKSNINRLNMFQLFELTEEGKRLLRESGSEDQLLENIAQVELNVHRIVERFWAEAALVAPDHPQHA